MYISEIMTTSPEEDRNSTETKLYSILDELSIPFERIDNDVVETMEECKEIDEKLGTEIRKTLFLCNRKKTNLYLIVLPADKQLDIKAMSAKLELPKLSFASAELMEKYLCAKPGSASVMGLINDIENSVELIIDKEVADAEWFGCNPGTNISHLKIKTSDLIEKILPHINHNPRIEEI